MKIKFKNTVIIFVLSLFLLMFSLTSCKEKVNDKPTETTIEEKYPDVNKPILPEGVNEEDFSFVYSSIVVDLASYGYDVFDAIADNGEEKEFGLGYTDYCQGFEDSEKNVYIESGFLSFSANKDDDLTNNALTYLTPINEELDIIDEDYKYIVGYFEEGIPSGHFILNDNYIKYEVEDGIVNIEKQANSAANYDLSIGRMFNYDTNEYEFIPFDEIASDPIEYTPLVEEIDYSDIKNNLSEVMDKQEGEKYPLENMTVAFISLDAMNQMRGFASQEDKLNGFTFEELDSIKYDNSRQYIYFEEDGSVSVRDIPPIPRDNNKQLLDWVIDSLILAGTATVALFCMVYGGPTGGVVAGGLIGAGIQYFDEAVINGNTFSKINWAKVGIMGVSGAIGSAIPCISQPLLGYVAAGVSGGLTSAAMTAVDGGGAEEIFKSAAQGAVTSIIMHGLFSSCFKAGTKVLTENGKESIENIKVGTKVASYNIYTGKVEYQPVLNTYINKSEEFVTIKLEDGKEITSTNNHPYYIPDEHTYVQAKDLEVGMYVLDSNNNKIRITNIEYETSSEDVYNINVDNNHNYFVGDDEILVHNLCKAYARRKAVKLAWKEAQANPQKYFGNTLSDSQMAELMSKGKIAGFEGHHIIPVKELVGTKYEYLIASPKNIVFLPKADHVYVHRFGDTIEATKDRLIEKRPDIAKTIKKLLKTIGKRLK